MVCKLVQQGKRTEPGSKCQRKSKKKCICLNLLNAHTTGNIPSNIKICNQTANNTKKKIKQKIEDIKAVMSTLE